MGKRRMRQLLLCCAAFLATWGTCVRGQEVVNDPHLLGTSMVIRGLKMYVFGGMGTNSTAPSDVLWEFDLGTRLWTAVTPSSNDKPPGRMFHSAVMSYDGRYMIVYGGIACFSRIQMVSLEKGLKEYHMQQDSIEYSSAMEDVWIFDFVTNMWSELSPSQYARRPTCPTAEGVTKLEGSSGRQVGRSWINAIVVGLSVTLLSYLH